MSEISYPILSYPILLYLLVEVMSLWDTTSSSVIGLYFSTLFTGEISDQR